MDEEKLMEVDGRWSKKEKEKRQRSGGPKFRPPHLNLAKSWVNSVKLSWLSQPKKKNLFQSFQVSFKIQIFNSNFSFPNFQFHILNAQILNSNLMFSKNQTSDFMIKIPSLSFQNSKFQNFRFQVPNFKLRFLSSTVLKFEIKISKLPSFKN